jgi:hypothetical protein
VQAKWAPYFFRIVYFALALTVGLFLYSLYKRPIHVDAAILGEPTYWLAHDGVLRSELQRGWQHAEEHFFFTHKLFLYIGAFWTTLLGWSSTTLNSLSLIYLCALFSAWILIAKAYKVEWKWFFAFALFLLTNHHIYELSFVYRPEIAVAAFSSWCFFFLDRYLSVRSPLLLVFAALVAGFGIGHHMNGVVIVIAGFFLLLSQRQYVAAVVFGAIGSLGLCYYLIDIRSMQDFHLMVSQFQHMQDIQPLHSTWVHYILNIPFEQKRFLHSPVEIGLVIFAVPLFIFSWRTLWARYPRLVIFAGTAILALALISHDKDTKYLSLHIPILTFLAVLSLRHIFEEVPLNQSLIFKNRWLPFFILLFFIGQWRSNYPITFEKDHLIESYDELAHDLPEGTHMLGPVFAVFWALPHHYRLQSFITYQVLASHDDFVMDSSHLATALDEFQIDALLVDVDATTRFQLTDESLPKFHFTQANKDLGLRFFRRKD